ncbi:MAG TPA: 1-acyl-sn-glycerol-3-phosphate acyltransferase [Burkholderiaceae bacterium]|jgi:1-acyl-sn-glycerol-3-phosphate acyltransferase
MTEPRLIPGPLPVQLHGSTVARFLMRLFGWRVEFEGLPRLQGVVMFYPHTSNWDFVIGIFAKWAIGIPVRFWAKDSLFKAPVFGPWVRWIGGVAVNRSSRNGMVADTAEQMVQARELGEMYWLAVAPEGTRSFAPGWRSGAYMVAKQAAVPVGLASLDYLEKIVRFKQFIEITGDAEKDFALMAGHLDGSRAKRPDQAGPVRLRS